MFCAALGRFGVKRLRRRAGSASKSSLFLTKRKFGVSGRGIIQPPGKATWISCYRPLRSSSAVIMQQCLISTSRLSFRGFEGQVASGRGC